MIKRYICRTNTYMYIYICIYIYMCVYTQKVCLERLISCWMSVRRIERPDWPNIQRNQHTEQWSNWARHTSVSSSAKSSSDKFKSLSHRNHRNSQLVGLSEQTCSGMSKQHTETNVGLRGACNIPVSGQYMLITDCLITLNTTFNMFNTFW